MNSLKILGQEKNDYPNLFSLIWVGGQKGPLFRMHFRFPSNCLGRKNIGMFWGALRVFISFMGIGTHFQYKISHFYRRVIPNLPCLPQK